MRNYLLDTDICISFLKDRFKIKEKIIAVGISNCFISEITVAELRYGAEKSTNFEKHSTEVDDLEILFDVIPIYENIPTFAKEKVRLQKEGSLIPDFDLLIGSTSIFQSFVLVTNNEKHLNRLQNIEIENWRKEAFNEFLK